MSIPIPPIPATGSGQVVVPAGAVRLAELNVGQLYRVTVTAVYPGKAEILIGNQYVLAATPFKFQAGDVITLKLIARTPELLQFQLALPGSAAADAEAQDLATLLRAAAMPDTAAHRAAMTLLLQAGIPVSARAMQDTLQLLAAMPLAAAEAAMPLYKELAERNIRLDKATLLQLARLQQAAPGMPPLAATLAGALWQVHRERLRGGQRRRMLEDALSAALASGSASAEASASSAQALKERVGLLYGAPENALLEVLKEQAAEEQSQQAAPELELGDLSNLLVGEELSSELADIISMLQAIRVMNSLSPGRLALSIPTLIADDPTDVQLSLQVLSEQYYHKDFALRIRIENETQGQVEFQLRTRGPGLYIDVLAEDEATREAYAAQAGRFGEELEHGTGFIVRKLEVSQHSL